MRKSFAPLSFPILIAAIMLASLSPCSARGDTVQTFAFTGTLQNPINGSTLVTGTFSMDVGTLVGVDIVTPVATFTTANSNLQTVTFASNADLVSLRFVSPNTTRTELILNFQTPLVPFNPNIFLTTPPPLVTPSSAPVSGIGCQDYAPVGCPFTATTFASGSATLVATPEPSALVVLVVSLPLLSLLRVVSPPRTQLINDAFAFAMYARFRYERIDMLRVWRWEGIMDRLVFRATLTALVLVVMSAMVPTASADGVTWILSGVTFDDGGTASGSFIYDADANTIGSINILTTQGEFIRRSHIQG